MQQINWNQFKFYKLERSTISGMDNFLVLIEFIRAHYNIVHIEDMYDLLADDELSAQMLEKRGIRNATALDDYLYRTQQTNRQ